MSFSRFCLPTPKTDEATQQWHNELGEIVLDYVDVEFAEEQERTIVQLEEALKCLYLGLVLDLRYADDDDDKDAMRSRIKTVEEALAKVTP